MNIPGPAFRPTMLNPNPLPGFFISSTSKVSIMFDVLAETAPFSLTTHDSSLNTTMVTFEKPYTIQMIH